MTVPTGDRTVGQVTLSRPGFNGMYIFDQFAPNNLTQTIASPTLPPWVQGSVSVSSAVRAASWFTVAGPGAVSDGQMLRMSWSHNIGGTFYPHTWYVMLPPGRNTFSFPEFPPAFVDNTPQPQDSMGASIRSFDVSSATSYDMLRTLSSAVPMCLECALYAGEAQRVVTTP